MNKWKTNETEKLDRVKLSWLLELRTFQFAKKSIGIVLIGTKSRLWVSQNILPGMFHRKFIKCKIKETEIIGDEKNPLDS